MIKVISCLSDKTRDSVLTNLSVSLNRRFPDVFQSESFAVVDQSDGFNVLPQLRQTGGGDDV